MPPPLFGRVKEHSRDPLVLDEIVRREMKLALEDMLIRAPPDPCAIPSKYIQTKSNDTLKERTSMPLHAMRLVAIIVVRSILRIDRGQ